jgi:amino acid transporter
MEDINVQVSSQPILGKRLGLRDLVFAQILAVVGNTWVGTAAPLGRAQAFTWIAAMLLFYVPLGAIVICLNRQTPLEGGIYQWARAAYGDASGFMVAWNVWLYAILYIASILFALPTELAYMVGPGAAWLPENRIASMALLIGVLTVISILAVRGLGVGKWIHNGGSLALLTVYIVLILLPFWTMHQGLPAQWTSLGLHLPQRTTYNMALFGQMLFGALSGLEYIAILAGESKAPARTIGSSVIIASPIICCMFILGTASVVSFVGKGRVDFIAPIPQTLRLAFGHQGIGSLLAESAIFLLEIRLLGISSFLFTGATRLPLTAGWDRLLPPWFTKLHSRWRTPTHSIWFVSGLIVLLLVVGSAGVHSQEAFQILINASSAHYSVAYMAMFSIPLLGIRGVRTALPGWLKWTSLVGLCATTFSFGISAYPFVDVVNPVLYGAKILGATLVSNAIGYCLYVAGQRPVRPSSHC